MAEVETKPIAREEPPITAETAPDAVTEKEETGKKKDDEKTKFEKKQRVGIISDASTLPESDDPKEIVKQIEFYFADSNLRYDKFLWSLVGEANNWVDIALVASFNRMRRFKSLDTIKKALEESLLMEINDDKTKMRRKKPMAIVNDPRIVDKAIERSIYAKGFGTETKTSQFDIEKFFEQSKIPINAVRLRRDDDKVFKGSVFVEFATIDGMKQFMNLEEKPKWNGAEMALIDPHAPEEENGRDKKELSTSEKAAKEATKGIQYMTKQDFVDMKVQGIREGKVVAKKYDDKRNTKFDAFKEARASRYGGNRAKDRHNGGSRGRGRGGRRDDRRRSRSRSRSRSPDNRDWRDRRDADRKNGFKDQRNGQDMRDDRKRSPPRNANGVPKVRVATDEEMRSKPSNDDGKKKKEPNSASLEPKSASKREREEDEGNAPEEREQSPVKKAKVETTV